MISLGLLKGLLKIRENLGSLAGIVENMYLFLEEGKDEGMIINDPVEGKSVPAKDYFRKTPWNFIVHPDFLPADVNVKGAYIPQKGRYQDKPCLEVSELDFPALEKRLQEDAREDIILKGRGLYAEGGGILIQTVTSQCYRGDELRRRTKIIAWPSFAVTERDLVLEVIDVIDKGNTYRDDPNLQEKIDKILQDAPLGQEMRLQQSLALQQVIKQEQSLGLQAKVAPRMIRYQELLYLPAEQLEARVREMGEELKAVEPYLQDLARRACIKKIQTRKPGLSLREAEMVYSRIIKRMSS